MAITKLPKNAFADNSVDASKIEDGTIQAVEISGTVSASKLSSTTDLSTKTVTLPNTSVTNDMLAGSIANAKLSNSTISFRGTSRALGDTFTLSPDVDWQSVKTSDFTAAAGQGYFIDTSSAAVTMTLPSSASLGDTIAFKDYSASFGTNALTVARNGHKIQGVANNSELSTNRASLVLVYVDTTKGWLYTNEHNAGDNQIDFIDATGGTVTTVGDFKVHAFTGDSTFVVSAIGNCAAGPEKNRTDVLVVAGGGGGGGYGGGGGAGGFRINNSFTVSAQTYPVTVGGGGAGGKSPSPGTRGSPGSNSVFSTITSAGGGGGGSASPSPNSIGNGLSGGSGGGGAGHNVSPYAAGSGNNPPVSPPQGNPGGNGNPYPGGAGGGGGAATAGTTVSPPAYTAGAGGNGSPVTSTFGCAPQPFYPASGLFAGGGGGGRGSSGGAGGPGGGGTGVLSGNTLTPTTPGVANSGGGGGGVCNANPAAGAGGKGIVLIRYKFQ